MFKSIDKSVGLRVSAEEEMKGLVLAEHGGNERGFKKPSRGQTHPIDKFLLL
jgi:ammonia channel protein AmtB